MYRHLIHRHFNFAEYYGAAIFNRRDNDKNIIKMTDNNNRISSPEGVSALMRELWECHTRGEKAAANNVYFVDLPEPTAEEREQMRRNRAERPNPNIPIDEEALRTAIAKFYGW